MHCVKINSRLHNSANSFKNSSLSAGSVAPITLKQPLSCLTCVWMCHQTVTGLAMSSEWDQSSDLPPEIAINLPNSDRTWKPHQAQKKNKTFPNLPIYPNWILIQRNKYKFLTSFPKVESEFVITRSFQWVLSLKHHYVLEWCGKKSGSEDLFSFDDHSSVLCVWCSPAVNSCSVKNGGCEHRCVDLGNEQYRCECHRDYQLKRDAKHCECEFTHKHNVFGLIYSSNFV